ncbi:VWA domain-containing protein [Halorubrum sp. CGM5_25_10-8B]|uniref:VWA domain-containing protein n=1 Tax=Halorubrum sp. CGM5_25_10-8B TaxID=2518115 RepID=UPI0010F7809C|nr:VWA domain-containing protein [Halorubrum sp. CGM5_25_10-8B]TKX37078.1 VWA domain-containing protein [Halorubrum sp. CGM5_25_10-8B]
MPLDHRHNKHQQVIGDLTPQAATRARISTQRADRLREFILSHLPDEVTVDVVITSGVQTAAVLPADVDAIVSSDATDIERAQAEQFLAGVDADYLVLVTGNEADLTRIPLNDQLTADHAHQFGLAFHELLHILKTAITTIGELLDTEIDSQYHAQVHDLINIIEDGAIESEAINGENFSDNAGIRLELTRRLHSQTPDDIPTGQEIRYSFWDAVTSCLYDEAIYPTGITDVLLDEDDNRVRFKSEADRDAFEAIHPELCILSRDALAIRSTDRDDTTHAHDKTASVRRARRVIQTWTDHIQPVLEADTRDHQQAQDDEQTGEDGQGQSQERDGDEQSQQQESGVDATGRPESASGPDGGDDISSGNGQPQNATADASATPGENAESPLPEDFDPSEVTLSRDATDDPRQNIFEQPQVTADPNPDDIDVDSSRTIPDDMGDTDSDGDGDDDGEAGGPSSESGSDRGTDASGDSDQGDDGDASDLSGGDSEPEPSTRAQAIAQATERAREREKPGAGNGTETESIAGDESGAQPTPADSHSKADSTGSHRPREQSSQLTLGNFEEKDQDTGDASEDSLSSSEGGSEGESESGSPGVKRDGSGDVDVDDGEDSGDTEDTENTGSTGSTSSTGSASDETQDTPDGPAHAQSSSRSQHEAQAAYEDALARDERAARTEADREQIDERALGDELDALADHLDRQRRQRTPDTGSEENSGQSGGAGYSPGSLTDLEILPVADDLVSLREWAAIEDGVGRVADTLEMYLRLDRRKSTRRGLSAGAYDTRAGHRLAIGDPRVCKSRTMGNEKQYALVLILDRSGSMRGGSPAKIEVATQALTRFALAAENLGIRVAVIDFIHGNARLVKPFSIETRHVQSSLLDTSCGGGTPLAEAIGLANDLVEAQRDDPLIISVGDDQTSADSVKDVIRRTYAPVCSLTIATDTEPGTLSGSASELATYYERQEAVYTPERLDDRLDQFASLLAGL